MNENGHSIAQTWFNERLRPGNWLDIDPREEIPTEITGWMRTLVHMQQIYFSPEIRRRRDAATLADEFLLWGAQLVQPHDGGHLVRINDEVRGVPYLRTGRAVEKGEPITLRDLDSLEYFDLIDDELDCGHFTIFWTGSRWVGAFDFRSGRAKCLSLIEKSLTFLSATKLSAKGGLAEPAVDTLHTACELLAKSQLILSHVPAHKWKSHNSISSAINREGRLGNVNAAFLALFNNLSDSRSSAKYATGYEVAIPSQDDIKLFECLANDLLKSVQRREPDGKSGDNR